MAAHRARRRLATPALSTLTSLTLAGALASVSVSPAAASPEAAARPAGRVPAPSFATLRPLDLGGLPGARLSGANAVNRRGQVVGASLFGPFVTDDVRPFLWDRGVMLDL